MSLDLDSDYEDRRDDVYEALEAKGFEKIEGVSTTWKHLIEAGKSPEALASVTKMVKKAVLEAMVDVMVVIQAGNAQSEPVHIRYRDLKNRYWPTI
jgi:hypothetical protein